MNVVSVTFEGRTAMANSLNGNEIDILCDIQKGKSVTPQALICWLSFGGIEMGVCRQADRKDDGTRVFEVSPGQGVWTWIEQKDIQRVRAWSALSAL
jgi:hypothetical protein